MATDAEKGAAVPESHRHGHGHDGSLTAAAAVKDIKSPGVARVEAISASITSWDRVAIFLSVFLVAYVYGLDGTLRYAYQPVASNYFNEHSLQATIGVVRSVIAAAAQPTSAKIADVFGRVELICVSVFFYIIGTIIESTAQSFNTFLGGSVIYQVGYTMIILLVEVIIADITSTRARLFFSYIPALPFIINTWVSGDISQAVLGDGTKLEQWRWGIGMFGIIYTVCAMPLIISLWVVARRAKRQGRLAGYKSSFAILGARSFGLELFWLLDVIGVILVIAVFALILVPLTIAGGVTAQWKTAHIIAPLVVGVVVVPAFVMWELRAPHPLVPFSMMKDRSVWAPMGIALCLNFAFTMQSDYLFTVLQVAFDFSTKAATRVTSLYSFTSVIVGPILGLVVYKVRRLKMFVVAGTMLYMVAFGILIYYRGGTSGSYKAGVIGGQVLLGVAGGLFPYTTQASLQVQLSHENLAVMTGIYLATYNIGSSLGNTVSGAIWSQVMPGKLEENLAGINATLAPLVYAAPFNYTPIYPVGTPERGAIIESYQSVQRLLTITGICLCVPLIFFSLMLRNPQLDDRQTLAKDSDSETESTM